MKVGKDIYCVNYNISFMSASSIILTTILLTALAVATEIDIGKTRLDTLQSRSNISLNRIINFTKSDFEYRTIYQANTS
jgi:hypothetical protein